MNFLSFVELQFYIVILYFKGEDLYFCLKNEHTFCLYINKYIGIVCLFGRVREKIETA